jgi:hypothetical protein
MDRIKAAAARGFGDEPLGFSQENRARYPNTYLTWQPFAAPLDFIRRAPGAAIGAVSSAGSEIYKAFDGTETDANRLERDLNILGQAAMVEGGVGGRYYVGKPTANPFRAAEGALSDEAAVARGTIAPTVPASRPPHRLDERTLPAGEAAEAAENRRSPGVGAARAAEAAARSGNQNALYNSAVQAFKASDLSKAGRALTKHPEVIGETSTTLRQALRTEDAINDAAHVALRDIMRNGVTTNPTLRRYGTVTQIQVPGGFGARWYPDGRFIASSNPEECRHGGPQELSLEKGVRHQP